MSDSFRLEIPGPRLHVVLEPRTGYSIQEVLLALEQAGAREVEQISSEFISAEIFPASISVLEVIAFVETKKPHGLA